MVIYEKGFNGRINFYYNIFNNFTSDVLYKLYSFSWCNCKCWNSFSLLKNKLDSEEEPNYAHSNIFVTDQLGFEIILLLVFTVSVFDR